MSTLTTTSAIPWLPTTSQQPLEEPNLAEQIAMMLRAERQVICVITGRESGRMAGFLADLTHAVSHRDTVLRIKAALDASELFTALGGQLGLTLADLTPMQVASKVGERLATRAPAGQYVLLCEAAHGYSDELLEGIRQINNYPINIVLCGQRALLRRLARSRLASLNQRVNYRLDLDGPAFLSSLKRPAVIATFAGLAFVAAAWLGPKSAPDEVATHAVSGTLPAAVAPAPAAPPVAPTAQPTGDADLALVLDRSLRTPPPAQP